MINYSPKSCFIEARCLPRISFLQYSIDTSVLPWHSLTQENTIAQYLIFDNVNFVIRQRKNSRKTRNHTGLPLSTFAAFGTGKQREIANCVVNFACYSLQLY